MVDHAICKIAQALKNDNTTKDNGGVPNEDIKSNANTRSSFGNNGNNKFGGKQKLDLLDASKGNPLCITFKS